MSDEPSLPKLPDSSKNGQSHPFAKGSHKRLRQVHSNTGTTAPGLYNSSDPAVFSSDDDPSLDNYINGRRKRKYYGSWYQELPTSSDHAFDESQQHAFYRPKQGLRRQLDSGVFMGSDDTIGNENISENCHIPNPSKTLCLKRPSISIFSEAERSAQETIRDCLEKGNESVDLGSEDLEDISNETIAPLAQLSCIPQVARGVAFVQRDPELKVYLSKNRLWRLPGSLFDLKFVTVLSLRDNRLTELPSLISKLVNLKELNVGQNRLRTLPPGLLDLIGPAGQLGKLTLYPNPFVQPDRALGNTPLDAKPRYFSSTMHAALPRFFAKYLGQTPLQFSTTKGLVTSKFRLSFDQGRLPVEFSRYDFDEDATEAVIGNRDAGRQGQSGVPSLIELALRSCHGTTRPENLVEYIPAELQQLRALVSQASSQKYSGGRFCSVCRKLMVTSAVEWVEWRSMYSCAWTKDGNFYLGSGLVPMSRAPEEIALPFLHRACSTNCSPLGKKVFLGWTEDYEIDVQSAV